MREKILVVDDDPDILDALTMVLEGKGYRVVAARDGLDGLASIKAEKPDLLILDLLMPKMDGFAICKELKQPNWAEFADMPILILSSVRERLVAVAMRWRQVFSSMWMIMLKSLFPTMCYWNEWENSLGRKKA